MFMFDINLFMASLRISALSFKVQRNISSCTINRDKKDLNKPGSPHSKGLQTLRLKTIPAP